MSISGYRYLIDPDLCTRCGACFAADQGSLLQKDPNGFPWIVRNDDAEEEKLKAICTGHNWPYRSLLEHVHGQHVAYDPSTPDIGHYLSVGIAYAMDDAAVAHGQSGGVSTTLIRAGLDFGMFDAFLGVTRPTGKTGDPFDATPAIIDHADDAVRFAGSKYTICSSLEHLPELAKDGRHFGMSLLPCQAAGFYQLAQTNMPNYLDQCQLIIGPFCGLNMEKQAGKALAEAMGLAPDEVEGFANRGGAFPGTTTFRMKDGSEHYLDRTAHRVLYRMFSPNRCFTCADYGNELVDIAVADVWLQGKNGYTYPRGAAWVIARTPRGQSFLEKVIQAGYLHYRQESRVDQLGHWKAGFEYRKVRAFHRIELYRRNHISVPAHDLDLPKSMLHSHRADEVEVFWRRLFRWSFLRRYFLQWWVLVAGGRNTRRIRRFESRLFDLFKARVFTHRSDVLSVRQTIGSFAGFIIDDLRDAARSCWKTCCHHIGSGIKRIPITPTPTAPAGNAGPVSGADRILIAGGYGYGNTGDEAQLGANLTLWKQVKPNAELLVLSPNPKYTTKIHAVKSAPASRTVFFEADKRNDYGKSTERFQKEFWHVRRRMISAAYCIRFGLPTFTANQSESAFLHLLASATVLHLSGGGYLTGMTRSRLWDHMLLLRLAKILGIPSMLTGHTIGVFQRKDDRKLAKWGLPCAKLITVRDRNESISALAAIGIKGDHIQERFDDALFCSQINREACSPYLIKAGIDPSKPYLVVNVHDWQQSATMREKVVSRFARLCDHMIRNHDIQILFCPMVQSDEPTITSCMAQMQQKSGMLIYPYDYRVVRGIIGAAQLCVTFKHHPIIFALGNDVPVIAIAVDDYYLHKNRGALALFGMAHWLLNSHTFFGGDAERLIDDLFLKRDQLIKTIAAYRVEYAEQAKQLYRQFISER